MGLRYFTPIPAQFKPTNIAGCLLYFNPTIGVTMNGSNQVTQWNDQSGNMNNATQSTAANGFVYTANVFGSQPGLLASTANSTIMFLNSATASTSQMSLFMLVQPTSAYTSNPHQMVFSLTTTGEGHSEDIATLPTSSEDMQLWDAQNDNYNYTNWLGGAGLSPSTTYLIVMTSGASPTAAIATINGTTQTIDTTGGTTWSIGMDTIGGIARANRYGDFYMGPLIVYNSTLTSTQITEVTNWYHSNGWL